MFETILVPLDGSEVGGRRAKLGPRPLRLRAVEPLSRRLAQPPAIFESPAAAAANVELLEKMTAAEREEGPRHPGGLGPPGAAASHRRPPSSSRLRPPRRTWSCWRR